MPVSTRAILDKLISFPSVTSESNLPILDYCQGFLTERGFSCHRVYDETREKAGFYAVLGPEGPGGYMLSGHTDVVPTTGQAWSSDPFTMREADGKLYGRGTTDMKGFLACAMRAADRAAGRTLREPLKIAFSFDEEIGCVGIAKMIDQLVPTINKPRYCIVGEPTSMQIATGHKGKIAAEAICHGTNGHSAMAPDFLNALHLAADFITGMRAIQADLAKNGAQDDAYSIPCSTVHVGKLQGGVALNIVPEKAHLAFELRHLAADDPAMLMQRIRDMAASIVAETAKAYPQAGITINQTNAYPGLDTSPDSDVVAAIGDLLDNPAQTKVAFGTEAGFFADLDIPTVVCGPGSMDQGHKPDEFVALEQLATCDRMLDRLLDTISA